MSERTTKTELSPIAAQIWDMKYRLKSDAGAPLEARIEDTWARVASAVARAEPPSQRGRWEREFYGVMEDFRFLPGGRILAGAGTERQVTLFNCFVMGTIPDDLGGIFESLKEAALTMQQGGGIGYDFSTLRPRGAPVRGVGADASGPLSFMDVWNAMCRTIMSAGARRGAMMATLSCAHPDIEAFIDAKREPGRLTMFNLSVLVSDAFIEAVRGDRDWDLVFDGRVYRTVRARDLWDRIMRATYDYAEPGVIFIDRINEMNNLAYCETIAATNPCGEQPLPPYGACLLGSVNLARFIAEPFADEAHVDEAALRRAVRVAVRFMDDVVDISGYPLDAQAEEARAKRRLGLGVTGLADALVMCGARYGSAEAAGLAGRWMALIEREAYLTSAAIAEEKGPFPLYDRDRFMASPSVARLDDKVRAAIRATGMRNALVTSIAPTGTISLLAGNVSSGVEPVFSFTYNRRILHADGSAGEEEVADFAYSAFRDRFGPDAGLPESFVTAQTLGPREHLVMQQALQGHVDSSISKTINVPREIGFADFKDIYLQAYDMGLKGCTTYRPNETTGAVLSIVEPAPPAGGVEPSQSQPALPLGAPEPPPAGDGERVVYLSQPLERDRVLPGFTYKLKWPDSDHAIYITINDIEQDGRRRPFEIFINSKNMEHYAWTVALTRMISAVFRRGGDVSFVVEELKAVFDPRGGQWMGGHYVPSLLAAIGDVIERHMIDTGFLAPPADRAVADGEPRPEQLRFCPRCDQPALIHAEGCYNCLACGWSKCG